MPTLTLPGNWQHVLDAFLQATYDRSGSDKSRANYTSHLSTFFASTPVAPSQVTRSHIRAYMVAPSFAKRSQGQPVSVSTRNGRLTALTSLYRFASLYEIDERPMWSGALPTAGLAHLKPEIKYRAMNTSELLRFFAVIPTDTPKGIRDRAILLTYFWTARRRSEIARLTYGDIEPATFDGSRQGHVYHYQSKGHARQTKTKELPVQAHQAIMAYLQSSGRLDTIKAGDPLFVALYAGKARPRPLCGEMINKLYKAYAAAAGLDKKLTLHSLRHTASRERKQSGQDIVQIKDLLDHVSLDTTWLYLMLNAGATDTGASLPGMARFAQL